jgi:preprotein translocase subunit YajC
MLISPAYAQAGGGGGDALLTFLPLILIFVVFYFLLIRPQQKRQKEHKAMVEALRRGDRVVTAGGLYGTVSKIVSDTEMEVEIADGVKVRMLRGTVQDVVSKSEPAEKSAPAKGRKKKSEPEEEPEAAEAEGDESREERK